MRSLQWRDWFLAGKFSRNNAEEHRLARLIIIAVFALGSWGPLLGAIHWWMEMRPLALVFFGTSALLWCLPFVLRSTGSVTLVGNAFVGLFFFNVAAISGLFGGIESPAMVGLVILPTVAWLLTSRGWRLLWCALSCAAIVAFAVLGYVLPTLFSIGPQESLLLKPVAFVLASLIALFAAWFLERTKRETAHQLEETNAAMKEHQRELVKLTHDLSMARDEAIKANRTKSSFLANMSHELRTPLNAIIGYAELLAEDAEDLGEDAFVDDLGKIQRSGQHLLALISDILDLSKIEAGRLEVNPERCELKPLLDEVVLTVEPLVKKNGNAFEFDCPVDIGKMDTDPTRLRQILLNLLSNAAKFTEGGVIALEVKRLDGGEWLSFAVRDTGIGMSEEQAARIFDAFIQADHLISKKYGGTGLGLAISRSLAQKLGGDIEVQSAQGGGSTFTLELPAETAQARQIRKVIEKRTATNISAFVVDRPLVLVVDDDIQSHDFSIQLLRKARFNVVAAFSAEEGLRLARELRPAVLLLDAMMPDVSGWELLTTLKSDPSLADIAVQMMSISGAHQRGYVLEVADYLTMPVERERLLQVLEPHQPRRELGPALLMLADDSNARTLFSRLLAREGWSAREARHANHATELLDEATPSVVFLDLMSPLMGGFGFLERMASHESWREIPVVALLYRELSVEDQQRFNQHIASALQEEEHSLERLEGELLRILAPF